MDFRYTTPISEMGACGVTAQRGDLGIAEAAIIEPGAAEESILWQRMQRTDVYRMPPLATHQVDEEGAALVGNWINDMVDCL